MSLDLGSKYLITFGGRTREQIQQSYHRLKGRYKHVVYSVHHSQGPYNIGWFAVSN